MLAKEKIHWSRMIKLFKSMDTIGAKFISFPIIAILVSIGHYCFMSMHTMFELYLFFSHKKEFNQNLKTINAKLVLYNAVN
jgi:hypothetical protein